MKTGNPEDERVLADIEAAKAAGKDPFGDDDPLEEVEDDAQGDGQAEAEPQAEADKEESKEAAEDGSEAEQAEAEEPKAAKPEAPPTEQPIKASDRLEAFRAEVAPDYAQKRAELLKEKAAALKQMMDGEIDVDGYAAEEARVSAALDDLNAQRIRAETLLEANTQTEAAYQQREINRLKRAAKAEIDYDNDQKAVNQFNAAMSSIAADPDNAGRDFAELIEEAHRVVATLRGITKPAPKATPSAPRQPKEPAPVTLRNIPSAATPNANGGVAEQMERLKGPAYEAAFAKLTPAQKRALLDEAA
ncbi:MAG: hypothetical protein HEQ39_09970 [Rhizobacter sp.]